MRSIGGLGRLLRRGYKLVLPGNADERREVLPLLVGETIDTTEIVLGGETTSSGTIAIDASHLKGSKAKAEQLGTVCLVGIEREGFGLEGRCCIVLRRAWFRAVELE
jgi:hypothetical protein